MSLIGSLLQLQAVDQEWDEKAQLYQNVRQWLIDQSELESMRAAQADREAQLVARSAELRDAELELASLQDKVEGVERDLYSGRTTSPRELEALRQDGEYLRRRLSTIEDRALEQMEQVDELDASAQGGRVALADFEARWADEREALTAQYSALRARLQELKAERDALRSGLTRAPLALYDELRRSKGGVVLAEESEGVCQTCHVTVPAYKVQQLRTGAETITCEGCGRILHPG